MEAFGAGTAAIVCPIERILYNGKNYNLQTMKNNAPYMSRAATEFHKITYGITPHEWAPIVD